MARATTPGRQRTREALRARARAGTSGVLQLGSARPHARALYPGEIERIWRAAPEVWPGERWFAVAVFARYKVGDPGDSSWGSGSVKVLSEPYGRSVGVSFGRRYWGWRGYTLSAAQLDRFADMIAPDILSTYGGTRPIHAVSVRPAHLE